MSHSVVLEAAKELHDFLDVTWDVISDDPEAEVQEEICELRASLAESLAANARLWSLLDAATAQGPRPDDRDTVW